MVKQMEPDGEGGHRFCRQRAWRSFSPSPGGSRFAAVILVEAVREGTDNLLNGPANPQNPWQVKRYSMEFIELCDICKTYRLGEIEVPVLKGVSLSISRGSSLP